MPHFNVELNIFAFDVSPHIGYEHICRLGKALPEIQMTLYNYFHFLNSTSNYQ